MSFLEQLSDDTIIACSSGEGQRCALSVIRISGFRDLELFQSVLARNVKTIRPRQVYYLDLVNGDKIIDSVCAVFFKAPASYTGENILELTVHGNPLNVENIIQLFVKKFDLRLAAPGEFSYRALKNKKLSLSQAEGLDLFLNSNSNFLLEKGQEALHGELDKTYLELREDFVALKASVELSIDFLEDVGEETAKQKIKQNFENLGQKLSRLHSRVSSASEKLLSPSILLMGEPNAGKSTLFNKLLDQERSITSAMAGTTRDYVSESVHVEGVTYRLVDTAGLRESGDEIESEGIKRGVELFETAFFKILLVNPTEHSAKNLSTVDPSHFDLVLYTHSDLFEPSTQFPDFSGSADKRSICLKKGGPIGPAVDDESGPIGPTDSKTGPMGPPEVHSLTEIWNLVTKKYKNLAAENPILISRHKYLIDQIARQYAELEALFRQSSDIAVISAELNNIGQLIHELIGVTTPEDILDNIFENFCIGK